MKQDDSHLTAYFERRLILEIEELNERIRDLENQRYALQIQLQKAKATKLDSKEVTRKNSMNRTLIESKTIEVLRTSTKPLPTDRLFRECRLVDYKLRENTFRTHLHRMKLKGLIESVGRGVWSLADTN
jgi:hypothetical protein